MSRTRAGFSLVEMMFVVVIISIVATIAVPTFMGTTQTDRLVQATGEIQQIFERARARALLKNSAVRIRIDRNPTDARANIRIDESPDATCTGFQRIAVRTAPPPDVAEADPYALCSTWLATEQHRCGLSEVHISGTQAWDGYKATGVTVLTMEEGAPGGTWTTHENLVLCMNRRGRMLRWSGAGWVPLNGGLRFRLDRREGRAGSFLGLVKEVYVPQGGIAGVMR
jgi:prepilin-type N-terminal cleavage/methylation domain-containing protein